MKKWDNIKKDSGLKPEQIERCKAWAVARSKLLDLSEKFVGCDFEGCRDLCRELEKAFEKLIIDQETRGSSPENDR